MLFFIEAVQTEDGVVELLGIEGIVVELVHHLVEDDDVACTAFLDDGAIVEDKGIEEVVAHHMPVAGRGVLQVVAHGEVFWRILHPEHLAQQGGRDVVVGGAVLVLAGLTAWVVVNHRHACLGT